MNIRLKRLQGKIVSAELDGFVSFNPANIFYLAGFRAENSFIFVGKRAILAVPKLIYFSAKESVCRGGCDLEILRNFEDFFKKNKNKKIGFESSIPYQTLGKLRKIPGIKFKSFDRLIEDMRVIKDGREISDIKTACEISKEAIRFTGKIIKTGMSEKELADKLEYFLRENGAEKSAFDIIVASGKNSANPHHKPANRKFRKDDIVLVDLGCVYRGYSSDLTRTYFLSKIDKCNKKVFDIAQEAQLKAINIIKDGVSCKKVDSAARNFIDENGFGKNYIHSTGHGVGIDIHEEPVLSAKSEAILRQGMVVTVEPGIYIPGKFGVRVEDTVLVTKNGCEVLT